MQRYAWKLRLQISPIAAMSMSAAGSSAKQQESLEHCVQWQLTGIDMFRTAKKLYLNLNQCTMMTDGLRFFLI